MSFFAKLFDETQMSAPLKATRHHNLIKLLILLPLRADLLLSVHSETPCTCYQKHDLESPLPTSILVKKCLLCCSLQAFFSIQHDLWDSELLLLPLNNLV